MCRKCFFIFFILLLFIKPFAQQQTTKYRIKAGKLFDSEAGIFKTGLTILVKGQNIEDVKEESKLTDTERKEYELIDLANYAILPGLIDAHTHLLSEEKVYPGNNDFSMAYLRDINLRSDALRALYGASRGKTCLEAGITAVQDLGNSGRFADIALRDAINLGYVLGPRMRCSGPGLSTEGGQLPGLTYEHRDLASYEYRIVKNTDDCIQAVRENITQGADVIKIYSNNTPNRTMLSINEIKAIVNEAHRYKVKVTAHATNNQAVYNAVMGGVDGIEHGYQIEDSTMKLMAEKGVIWVPTNSDSLNIAYYFDLAFPKNPEMKKNIGRELKKTAERLQRGIKNGIIIVAGADDYVDVGMPYGETYKRTLFFYNQAGMPITDLLKAATINAANHLRWGNKIGIIKKDFWADMVAVDNNIDTDINSLLNVHFVMKGGKVIVRK